MKNLFKNLMLVAVAAMAFTACTETNDEVNAVVNKTRYEFTANIAEETRSGFAEKEEGATAYKSEWFGDETLKIFVTDYNTYNVETTASINAEGQFALELENAPESFFITAVSPAESWVSEYTATIPAEQTPLANSVDPKAHLLQAQAVPVSGNSGDINFTHMAAYGKMTVNGVAFAIDHVVVDLKGTFYGYDRELSYTINADNVEENTFWFATEPIDVAEFTVTAYDAEGSNSVTKTVDVAEAGKTMSFQYGRVGTFSVSGLQTVIEPEEPFAEYIATELRWDSAGYFVFVVDHYEIFRVKMNDADCPNHTTIKEGTYTAVASSSVPAGSFSVYQKVVGGYSEGWSSTNTASTMSVEYVNGEYVIIVNYIGKWGGSGEVGYKGVPSGWDVPTGGESGGGEPVNPDPEQGNELGSESNPYTFTSVASNGFFLNFEGAENGASLQLDRQNSDVNQMSNLGKPFALNYTAIIYAGSGNVYNDGEQVYQYASFAPYSTLEVTKADGNWTCKLKMSVDGGATFTYYTYTGQIANQAY